MATLSSFLAWEIPWTEVPAGLQSIGSQRVKHNGAHAYTHIHTHTHTHSLTHKLARREFPGSPVIRTQCFHCLGPGSSLVRELKPRKPCSQKKKKLAVR